MRALEAVAQAAEIANSSNTYDPEDADYIRSTVETAVVVFAIGGALVACLLVFFAARLACCACGKGHVRCHSCRGPPQIAL